MIRQKTKAASSASIKYPVDTKCLLRWQ